MAPTLETMPDELKEHIFGFLIPSSYEQGENVSDVIALRSLNKEFREYFAEPFYSMFETVSVACHENSLQRLVDIAQYAPISDLVQEVVVSTNGLRRKCLRTQIFDPLDSMSSDDDACEAVVGRENMVLASGLLAIQLGIAFRNLRHCNRVEISESYQCPEMLAGLPKSVDGPASGGRDFFWPQRATRIISAVAGAMNNSKSSFQHLALKTGHGLAAPFYPFASLTQYSAGTIFKASAIANLRSLELKLHFASVSRRELFGLVPFLNSARKVERLDLSMTTATWSRSECKELIWDTIFQNVGLPNLQVLELSGGATSSESLCGFLEHHLLYLKELSIGDLYLMNEPIGWIEVLKFMAGKLTLRHFHVHNSKPCLASLEITWEGKEKPRRGAEGFCLEMDGDVGQQLRQVIQTFAIKMTS